MNQVRRLRLPALAVVAVLGLGACLSNPSARTVAEDWIESMDDLTDAQRTCLIATLDEYTDDELDLVAAGTENVDFGSPDAVESAPAPFQDFVENLDTSCMQSG